MEIPSLDHSCFDEGHNLQSYTESNPSTTNPNAIPIWEWWEWDFSLEKNIADPTVQYCFRVLTQFDDEIVYSSYATIDTTDAIDPTISSYSPGSWSLMPIGNFVITYEFEDLQSGIDTGSDITSLQRWNGSSWDTDISGTYMSLDEIHGTGATYDVTWLPYGRYRVGFEIYDNAWNNSFIIHEVFVDEVEFIISSPEMDVWNIYNPSTKYTSSGTLTATVRTVGAAFDVTMLLQSDMLSWSDLIDDWDGTKWFWFEPSPFGTVNSFGTGTIIWSEGSEFTSQMGKRMYIIMILNIQSC